jgi:hypothetical protein
LRDLIGGGGLIRGRRQREGCERRHQRAEREEILFHVPFLSDSRAQARGVARVVDAGSGKEGRRKREPRAVR